MLQGSGAGPQGIFMRDEVGTLPYRNVAIENNLMYGSDLWHGIVLENAIGAKATGNTVLSPSNDNKRFWISVSQGRYFAVSKNVF